MFAEQFANYTCIGDQISCEVDGFEVTARIVFDDTYTIDDDDCHNPDRDVTGCTPEQHEKAMAARQAWLDDDWSYVGVVLSVSRAGVDLDDHAASLWGIECNYPGVDTPNAYLTEVANELLPEALDAANDQLDCLLASVSVWGT